MRHRPTWNPPAARRSGAAGCAAAVWCESHRGERIRPVGISDGHALGRALRTAGIFATGAAAGVACGDRFSFFCGHCRARPNLARRKNSMRRLCRSSMTTRGASWPAMRPGPTTRRLRSEAGGNSTWPTGRRILRRRKRLRCRAASRSSSSRAESMQSVPTLSGRITPCRCRRRATSARNRSGYPWTPTQFR